jgi:hypothetical protein
MKPPIGDTRALEMIDQETVYGHRIAVVET